MIKDVGAGYVLCGHSERRSLFGDDDTAINRKVSMISLGRWHPRGDNNDEDGDTGHDCDRRGGSGGGGGGGGGDSDDDDGGGGGSDSDDDCSGDIYILI